MKVASDSSADRTDNFAPLTSLDWQVHVYGEPAPGIAEVCQKRGLALHPFSWGAMMGQAGLKRGAVYLVRPDGYIGLADAEANPVNLERYLDSRAVCPRPTAVKG
jgi:hypothetical protein